MLKYFFYFGIISGIIMLDQWAKWIIVTRMGLYTSITVIENVFFITSHRNRGAAFGILQNQQLFFISTTLIVIIALIYYLWKLKTIDQRLQLPLMLILGGAMGNFIDRIRLGEVVDFLDVRFGSYHFPVFNIADSVIVIGVLIFILLSNKYSAENG